MPRHITPQLLVLLFGVPFTCTLACSGSATLDEYLQAAKEHKEALKDSDAINAKLFQPALSDQTEFETFDGVTRFKANIVCGSEAPVVRVTAFPVGSLAGIGEVNIRIEYDRDLDGTLEGVVTVDNVGGMCGNGLIKDCSPSGSWKGCRYCRWSMDGGALHEQCDYGGSGGTKTPLGPQGMQGCFCFNASCGAPAMSMMEEILSFAATGVLNELRKLNNTMVISKVEYKAEAMQLSYLGSRVTNCSQVGNDATIQGLTGLFGKFEFPTADAIREAEADPEHPYNSIAQHFGEDGSTYQKCVMEAKVGVETKEAERSAVLDFGIGVDADGGSQQCFWFRGGYCGTVFGETGDLSVCEGRIVPAGLSDICTQMLVNSGTFTTITNVSDSRPTSPVGNYAGCYGADNDAADRLWETRCWGLRLDDVFVCKSPSMSLPGKVIRNAPYNPALFQGCEEVHEPANSCAALEKRRADGECELHSEVADGVYTVRDGAVTGLEPAQSCRTVTGSFRALSVCEPWWKRERVYRCKGQEPDFSQIKERAQYVGDNIDYDETTDTWLTQGDLRFKDGAKEQAVYDPNLVFQPASETCIPACRVRRPAKVTDIYVPGQGKLAPDGSYHMDSDGQLSATVNRDSIQEEIRECKADTSLNALGGVQRISWTCPVSDGETVAAGCMCFDAGAFGQAVATLQMVNMASSNMICSTGQEVGICSAEDQNIDTRRVLCGDFARDAEGNVQTTQEQIYDCIPKLWIGNPVAPQVHRVYADDAYRCIAHVPDYPEDDHFANTLGPLSPVSPWFDPVVVWAKVRLAYLLAHDPAFIPLPPADCACGQTPPSGQAYNCAWTVHTSVENVNRNDVLGLNPTSEEPFGHVLLGFSRVGSWGGSHTGTCTQFWERDGAEALPSIVGQCTNVTQESWQDLSPSCRSRTEYDDSGRPYQVLDCLGLAGSGPVCDNVIEMYTHGNSMSKTFQLILSGNTYRMDAFNASNGFLLNGEYYYQGNFIDNCIIHVDDGKMYGVQGFYKVKKKTLTTTSVCNTTGAVFYNNYAGCVAACPGLPQYRCKYSGQIVTDPAACPIVAKISCSLTGAVYPDMTSCSAACSRPISCNAMSDDYTFRAAIRNSGNQYFMDLSQTAPDVRFLESAAYPHENMILQQCVDRYTRPYAAFDDPATGGHFEQALMDELIYQWSAERGEAVRDNSSGFPFTLPLYPPVYRPAFQNEGMSEPSPIKNIPMYRGKSLSASWRDDNALRLGEFTVTGKNLIPHVYYYECPKGVVQKSGTNSCGAVEPFGGVDWTVKGPHCFTHRCDPNGLNEPSANYGRCGMVNDARWQ